MKHFRVGFVALLLLAGAVPAAAQSPVEIRFENGYVTLVARNAPVRTILAEWARVGGSKIVNAERVAGAPLTLEINHEPERKALGILLRNVSGYVAASRDVTASGASSFDRIHILPTPPPVQVASAPTTPPARPATNPTTVVRFFPGDANDDGIDDNVVGALPQPRPAQVVLPPAGNTTVGGPSSTVGVPSVTIPRPGQDDQPAVRPATPTSMPTFPGAASAGRPGEITPVQQPRRPEDAR